LYPHKSNASDYKTTNESFDTIALHHRSLHNKLQDRCREIGPLKLTREQKYIAKAMGTDLPFLPFVHKDEHRAFAKYVLDGKGVLDFKLASEEWCDVVDGKSIMPKFPAHIRTHNETWSRNKRVEESVKSAKAGHEKLEELNLVISPSSTATTPNAIGTDNSFEGWKEPSLPQPLPQPSQQAVTDKPFQVVGRSFIGENPMESAATPKAAGQKCGVCRVLGCKGIYNRKKCPKASWRTTYPPLTPHPNFPPLSSYTHSMLFALPPYSQTTSSSSPSISIVTPAVSSKSWGRSCKVCATFGGIGVDCVSGSRNRNQCKYFYVDGRWKR
jgi:hypothetical protein